MKELIIDELLKYQESLVANGFIKEAEEVQQHITKLIMIDVYVKAVSDCNDV